MATWREGASLDVGAWLTPTDGRTPAVIVSVAHLDEDDRAFVLGLVLDEVLAWVRGLSGTSSLRALIAFDEVYGFLPPHPANPPTKRPLLQTDADRERVVDGMADATSDGDGPSRAELTATIKKLAKRWFVLRNVHAEPSTVLMSPRWAISWMKGPLTRVELRRAVAGSDV